MDTHQEFWNWGMLSRRDLWLHCITRAYLRGGYGFKPQNKCITIINSSKFKTHYHIQWKPKQTVKKPNNSLLHPCYIVIIIIIVAVSIINKGKDVGKVLELQDMHWLLHYRNILNRNAIGLSYVSFSIWSLACKTVHSFSTLEKVVSMINQLINSQNTYVSFVFWLHYLQLQLVIKLYSLKLLLESVVFTFLINDWIVLYIESWSHVFLFS